MKFLRADDPDLAEKLGGAIGAEPGDTIEIVTPQFERPKNWPQPGGPPQTTEEWDALRYMTLEQLLALGCGNWDGLLVVFPGEWYASIPEGYQLHCISGETLPHLPLPADRSTAKPGVDYTDDDIRFGCLAYGVKAAT